MGQNLDTMNSCHNGRFCQPARKLITQLSIVSSLQQQSQYITHQCRQNAKTSDGFLIQYNLSTFSGTLLYDVMNTFFQGVTIMEDKVMFPLSLRDMPIEEVALDSSAQPESWHGLYIFVLDIRNQLISTLPFVTDNNFINEQQDKDTNDDDNEILLVCNRNNQHPSTSSTVSLDECDQSTSSSVAASLDMIKDELKYHYYGLIESLDNLTSMTKRIIEKYQEDSVFKM